MENVPKETETIAVKRSARIAEKIKNTKEKITRTNAWWSSSLFEVFLLGLVFFINFYSVSSYIGTQTYEFTFYSGPVVPLISKIFEFFNVELSYGLQLSNIVFILIFPLSFYYFVRVVTERKIVALLATLLVSLPFYPFAQVRIASGLVGLDGAHISSLTISMFALSMLFRFIKEGGAGKLTLASIFISLVALTSPFGFSTFLVMAAILSFSEMLLGLGRVKFLRLIASLIISACLISFWYNPHFSFWLLTGTLGEEVRRTLGKLLPISFFAIPALGAFGYLLFDRKPSLQPVFLSSFFTIFFAITTLAGGGFFPSHPSRYVSELGISLALLISVVGIKIFENLSIFERNKFIFRLSVVFVVIGLTTAIILGNSNVAYDSKVLGLWTDIEKGSIWKERERFGGISSISGYIITFLGTSSLFYINIKSKKVISS